MLFTQNYHTKFDHATSVAHYVTQPFMLAHGDAAKNEEQHSPKPLPETTIFTDRNQATYS